MSNKPPSDHHFVPAFYLRRWHEGGKLVEFSKPYKSTVSKSVTAEATGFVRDLYRLRGYEAELAQQVELKFFSPIDHMAAQALQLLERLGHAAPWTSASRSAWSRFILGLELRAPEDVDLLRRHWPDRLAQTDDASEARYRGIASADDPESLTQYVLAQPEEFRERTMFEILSELIDHQKVVMTISNMEWRVMEMPSRAPLLLTSDRPVVRTTVLKHPRSHIALPIGPRLLFLAAYRDDVLGAIARKNRVELAEEMNRQVVSGAVRYVYASDKRQAAFIEKHFGTRPRPRLVQNLFAKPAVTANV